MREEVLQVVSVYDPAIDTESMQWSEIIEYARKRGNWRTSVKLAPGKLPVVYHLREVPNELWFSYVRAAPSDPIACLRAFQASVVLVENLPSRDGARIDRYEPSFQIDRQHVIADADLARFPRAAIEEIGKVAWDHSFLAGTIGSCFQLPLSLVGLLTQRPFRHADASPTEPASSSDEASRDSVQALKQQLTATTHTDSGGDCGSPTAATAAE